MAGQKEKSLKNLKKKLIQRNEWKEIQNKREGVVISWNGGNDLVRIYVRTYARMYVAA